MISTAAPVLGWADPLADLVDPPHELASVLPTPPSDPFYAPRPGFETTAPGTILASRPAGVLFPPTARSTELVIRSADAKNNPVPVVATLFVPDTPWTGPGSRPLVSYNSPISSLGNTCAPSRKFKQAVQLDQLPMATLLARNYAVVVPDHQGPRQAYAAGRMEGHAVLDTARAVTSIGLGDLRPDSPIVLTGYSGGAIATGWAAQLAADYAPELNLAGALAGGTPADYRLLRRAMDGNLAAGVFLSAALGLAREYPELLTLLNDNGWRLAHALRDSCVEEVGALGMVGEIKLEQLTTVPDPLKLPWVQQILTENTLGATAPGTPVFIYHGADETFIPLTGARNLHDDWCRQGARTRLEILPGEHFIVGAHSQATAQIADWTGQLLAANLVPPGCTTNA
ncbi:lipase family protein [Nocardia pseudobrasiliensis]|uniref:lipase family protein n=1 Tax=Nocardia pseudobrasiliensis TaxID=45979 RepID=UPI001FE548B3|nr:lipase family protein [Nocardia pseudobrasiliensis]